MQGAYHRDSTACMQLVMQTLPEVSGLYSKLMPYNHYSSSMLRKGFHIVCSTCTGDIAYQTQSAP